MRAGVVEAGVIVGAAAGFGGDVAEGVVGGGHGAGGRGGNDGAPAGHSFRRPHGPVGEAVEAVVGEGFFASEYVVLAFGDVAELVVGVGDVLRVRAGADAGGDGAEAPSHGADYAVGGEAVAEGAAFDGAGD